jgi:hypothetical protein
MLALLSYTWLTRTLPFLSLDGRRSRRPHDVRFEVLHRCLRGQLVSRYHLHPLQLVVSSLPRGLPLRALALTSPL